MSLFNSILNDIKGKIEQKNAYKKVVVKSIKENLNINICDDEIVYLRDGVLKIQTVPSKKMLINLKKNNLIKSLNDQQIKVYEIR